MRSAERDHLEKLRCLALQKAFALPAAVAIAPYLQLGFVISGVRGLPTAWDVRLAKWECALFVP